MAGLSLGQVSDPYSEPIPLVEANEDALSAAGGSWADPPDIVTEKHMRWPGEAAMAGREVIKDPRITVMLPLYRARFPDAAFLGVYRHPAEVARSIVRDHRDVGRGEAYRIWTVYNERLLRDSVENQTPVVEFTGLKGLFESRFRAALAKTGVYPMDGTVSQYDATKMRNFATTEFVPRECTRLYWALEDRAQEIAEGAGL